MEKRGGGIALFYRSGLQISRVPIDAPDLLAAEVGDVLVVGAYLCPASSRWSSWTTVDPELRLEETLTSLAAKWPERTILLLLDANARTGCLQSCAAPDRLSSDRAVPNARGRWLLTVAEMADLFKSSLDGTSAEDEGLDSEEYKILEDSGVLAPKPKGGRRKAAAARHVVFASSLEEGVLIIYPPPHSFNLLFPTHSSSFAELPKRQ